MSSLKPDSLSINLSTLLAWAGITGILSEKTKKGSVSLTYFTLAFKYSRSNP